MRIIGDDTNRFTLNARQCRDHSETETASEFKDGIDIKHQFNNISNVVRLDSIDWNGRTQLILIVDGEVANWALKIRQVLLC